jgi:hypothetical protein
MHMTQQRAHARHTQKNTPANAKSLENAKLAKIASVRRSGT